MGVTVVGAPEAGSGVIVARTRSVRLRAMSLRAAVVRRSFNVACCPPVSLKVAALSVNRLPRRVRSVTVPLQRLVVDGQLSLSLITPAGLPRSEALRRRAARLG